MRLYTYFRSTSSYRVRIALALKGVACDHHPVHLLRGGGEQFLPDYLALNPQGRVPTLVLDDGTAITQSPAILEYLEEAFPTPPLLPPMPIERAKVRAVAAVIGCDVHPLNNVSVLNALRHDMTKNESELSAWIARWNHAAFNAVEQLIGDEGYCFGAEPSLADIYLVPQIFSARRFNVSIDAYPRILRVDNVASKNPAFQAAHPARQPDAE
jgi:maleylacetoacetate isomerase